MHDPVSPRCFKVARINVLQVKKWFTKPIDILQQSELAASCRMQQNVEAAFHGSRDFGWQMTRLWYMCEREMRKRSCQGS
jgi:hypothetical protein